MDTVTFPESLDGLSRDELTDLHAEILAAAKSIREDGDTTPSEKLEQISSLRDKANEVKAGITALDQVDQEVEAISAELGLDDDGDDAGDTDAADDAGDTDAADDTEAADDSDDTDTEATDSDSDDAEATDAVDEDDDFDATDATDATDDSDVPDNVTELSPPDSDEILDEASDDPDDPDNTTEKEPTTVAASSASSTSKAAPSAAAINGNRKGGGDKAAPKQARPVSTITAAANLPSVDVGAKLDLRGVADGLNSRFKQYPGRRAALGTVQQDAVAVITKPASPFQITKGMDEEQVQEVLDRAADEHSITSHDGTEFENLAAAGGWCAPSETWYDFAPQHSSATAGILSLPTTSAPRGGIRHTLGPDFRAIYNGSLTGGETGRFHYTEAEDEVGDYDGAGGGTKPCVVIPCPDFDEVRLETDGLCITGGILQSIAYPEMTERFVAESLAARAHVTNADIISRIVAASTAVAPEAFGGSVTSLLGAAELVATDMRYAQRMEESATIEAVFPLWVKGLFRADLSNRAGVPLQNISDNDVMQWLRERGVNPQFVYDWQDELTGDGDFGGAYASPITAWPNEFDFLMYPAGTHVKMEQDVITLDARYELTDVKENNYNELFVEDAYNVLQRDHDSRVVTVAGYGGLGQANLGESIAPPATDGLEDAA